jgi:hypothetical protein
VGLRIGPKKLVVTGVLMPRWLILANWKRKKECLKRCEGEVGKGGGMKSSEIQ